MLLDFPRDVDLAAKNISPFIRKTYFSYSTVFSNLLNTDVRFKMENLQVTGSFKARGAVNKLLSLTKNERQKGVVSASTGNHGAAVAYAAQKLNVKCSIFVPNDASEAKLQNIKNYDAKIEIYGKDCVDSEMKAREVARPSMSRYMSLPIMIQLLLRGREPLVLKSKISVRWIGCFNYFCRWWWTYWRYCVLPKICLA